ncbi:hypothetical protein GCM10008904_07230 [Paraclostridium ghonii]
MKIILFAFFIDLPEIANPIKISELNRKKVKKYFNKQSVFLKMLIYLQYIFDKYRNEYTINLK